MTKTIKFELALTGHGVVQTGGDERHLTFARADVAGQRHDNVTYAKGNFVRVGEDDKGRPRLRKILKISGDGLRHAIHVTAMPAHTPDILHSTESRLHMLATKDSLLRGWMLPETEERKRSAYAITSAQDPNAVLTVEMFSSSKPKVSREDAAKREDGSTVSDTSLFARETTGDTNYTATGFIDISELRFISISDIYGRRALIDDLAELYRERLSAHLGSEVDVPRYWLRDDGASNIPERGILLNDAQVQSLVSYLLQRMSEIHIQKSQSGFARASRITVTPIENNRLVGESTVYFDENGTNQDAIPTSYRNIWQEISEADALAAIAAVDEGIKAGRADKAAKSAAKAEIKAATEEKKAGRKNGKE